LLPEFVIATPLLAPIVVVLMPPVLLPELLTVTPLLAPIVVVLMPPVLVPELVFVTVPPPVVTVLMPPLLVPEMVFVTLPPAVVTVLMPPVLVPELVFVTLRVPVTVLEPAPLGPVFVQSILVVVMQANCADAGELANSTMIGRVAAQQSAAGVNLNTSAPRHAKPRGHEPRRLTHTTISIGSSVRDPRLRMMSPSPCPAMAGN
jgi:hypothetical protein